MQRLQKNWQHCGNSSRSFRSIGLAMLTDVVSFKHMASPTTQMRPELTERDLEPVRDLILGLIEDVRRQEQEKHLVMALATWLSAFSSFKRARKKIGLPTAGVSTLNYGAILAALKATGKMLLVEIHRGKMRPESIGMSLENFTACVCELQDDDRLLEAGLLDADADLSAAEAAFGLR